MKVYIKSYHVFLSQAWLRWCVYLVYPLLLFLLVLKVTELPKLAEVGAVLGIVLLVNIESFLDYFKFGGIASKDTNKLEYIKTSVKGLPILRNALLADEFRRFVSIVLVLILPLHVNRTGVSCGSCLAMVAMVVLFAGLGVFFTRKFTNLSIIMSILMVGNLLVTVISVIIAFVKVPWWMALPMLAGAIWVMYFLNSKTVMRKARDSYYDERD